jgi:DNA repair photolyase
MASRSKGIRGRGASVNPDNRFQTASVEKDASQLQDPEEARALLEDGPKTRYIHVQAKSLIHHVPSPDLPDYSMNPYQGCEHGCSYCYARNTHEYWGYSAGTDFESIILVKDNAPQLLEKDLSHPKWNAATIMLAGNTDIYQPAEQQFGITRKLLEMFYKYRHPVGLITKNALVKRDIDILSKLASLRLTQVVMSLTTTDESLKRNMEPRTSTAAKVFDTISALRDAGIPVKVLMAPIIPSLNDSHIFELAERAAQAGALSIGYQVVRLNGQVGVIFEDWIRRTYPDRAEKVLNQIRALHGGTLNDSRFGVRMKGEGNWAEMIRQQMHLARKKYFKESKMPEMDFTLHAAFKGGQLRLFD